MIRAKGVLLNEPALPWFINEEDVPVTGKILTRSYQRVRWYGGRTCLVLRWQLGEQFGLTFNDHVGR